MTLKINKVDGNGDLISPTPPSKSLAGNNKPSRKVIESFLTMIATGYAPYEAIESIKEEFGITFSPQQAAYYNPDNVAAKDLKPEYKEFFYKVKRDFVESLEKIPMSHAAVRVKRLEDIHNKAVRKGDLKAATNALKEARIEMDKYIQVEDTPTPPADNTVQSNKGD